MYFPGQNTGPVLRCREAGTDDRLPRCAVYAVHTLFVLAVCTCLYLIIKNHSTTVQYLIIKNHKLLAFHGICAKIFFVRNTEAVAQWQSACLWNKMLWVRNPPASPKSLFSFNLRVNSFFVNSD